MYFLLNSDLPTILASEETAIIIIIERQLSIKIIKTVFLTQANVTLYETRPCNVVIEHGVRVC
jgi:hypothetical protein